MKKRKLAGILLAAVLAFGTVAAAAPQENLITAQAADELKLGKQMKIGKTCTFTCPVYFYPKRIFKKNKSKASIIYKVGEPVADGDNYKVKVDVKWKIPNVPINKKSSFSYNIIWPTSFYTVIDYKTQKCLELKNKIGVKVKASSIKSLGSYTEQYFNDGSWLQLNKGSKTSFTVTYPKDSDIVIILGSAFNKAALNDDFYNGKVKFSKTAAYKQDLKYHTCTYLRLNNTDESTDTTTDTNTDSSANSESES